MNQLDPLPITVLVADDHPGYRGGIVRALQRTDFVEVVGEAGDGGEAAEMITALRPDVVLLDLHMPVMDGIAAWEQAGASATGRALLLTAELTDEVRSRARSAGFEAALPKDLPRAAIVQACQTAGPGRAAA